MNEKELVHRQMDFSGGLNNSVPPHMIADNEVADCWNVDFTDDGGIQTMPDWDMVTTTATSYNTGDIFKYSGISQDSQLLVTDIGLYGAGTSIYKINGLVPTNIYSSLTAGYPINTIQFINTLIIGNGKDSNLKYDGTTVSTLGGSSPNTSIFEVAYSRLFITGNPAHPNRVYYCDTGDIETWGASSYFDVRKNDGDKITGLKLFRDRLIIFKEYSIWVANVSGSTPSTDWSNEILEDGIGCVAGRTITPVLNDIYFLAHDGVYSLSRITEATATEVEIAKLSNKIQKTIDEIDKTVRWYFSAVYYKNKYYLTIPLGNITSTVPSQYTLIYSCLNKNWTKYLDIYTNQFLVYQNNLLRTDPSGYYIYYLMDSLDNVNSCGFKSKQYSFGAPTLKKRFTKAFLTHEATGNWNNTFGWSVDFEPDWNSKSISEIGAEDYFGTDIYGTARFGWGEQLTTRIFLPTTTGTNHGRYLQYRYDASGQSFKINGIETWFEQYEPFGITTTS